jgi:hypothetical protein
MAKARQVQVCDGPEALLGAPVSASHVAVTQCCACRYVRGAIDLRYSGRSARSVAEALMEHTRFVHNAEVGDIQVDCVTIAKKKTR